MATSQSLIYGTWKQSQAPLVIASLAGLGLGQPWEFAQAAATHGGIAFVLTWLLFLVLIALPLRMTELMLGKRSRRGLIEGMAFLTREADTRTSWRLPAWLGLLAGFVGLPVLVLLGGWGLAFASHHALSVTVLTADTGTSAWLAGSAAVASFAAVLAWFGLQRVAPVFALVLVVTLIALLYAAAVGVSSGGLAAMFSAHGVSLGLSGVALAARFAASSLAGGIGLVWLIGSYQKPERGIAPVVIQTLLVQAVLALLVALAVAPVAAIAASLPGHALTQQLPAALTSQGIAASAVYQVLALAAGGLLTVLLEQAMLFLQERGFAKQSAFIAVLVLMLAPVGALAATSHLLWLDALLSVARCGALLSLLGLCIFAGWVMKISHARRELGLPGEFVYNLWRVAVRIVCPLAILLALVKGWQ